MEGHLLTELIATAELFEGTLEQDHKQKSNKLLALQLKQLQGQRSEIKPETLILSCPGGPPSKLWPKDQCLICN